MTRRTARAHSDWCAADHRCNLTEHRSHDTVIALPGAGRAVLTRVRDDHGREYGEIRARLRLDAAEPIARAQLRTALTDLSELLSRAALRRAA